MPCTNPIRLENDSIMLIRDDRCSSLRHAGGAVSLYLGSLSMQRRCVWISGAYSVTHTMPCSNSDMSGCSPADLSSDTPAHRALSACASCASSAKRLRLGRGRHHMALGSVGADSSTDTSTSHSSSTSTSSTSVSVLISVSQVTSVTQVSECAEKGEVGENESSPCVCVGCSSCSGESIGTHSACRERDLRPTGGGEPIPIPTPTPLPTPLPLPIFRVRAGGAWGAGEGCGDAPLCLLLARSVSSSSLLFFSLVEMAEIISNGNCKRDIGASDSWRSSCVSILSERCLVTRCILLVDRRALCET
mmetsp:Transcript_32870/g.73195  ORF Transcript_32870/g.73195 Transcript_32870/m.73195 type:complete len:304 (+) Transcript_32870:164-1075(+)